MKKRRHKKTCHKVVYNSKEDARTALNEFGRARGAKRYYRCPHHDTETWHLTSEDK